MAREVCQHRSLLCLGSALEASGRAEDSSESELNEAFGVQ